MLRVEKVGAAQITFEIDADSHNTHAEVQGFASMSFAAADVLSLTDGVSFGPVNRESDLLEQLTDCNPDTAEELREELAEDEDLRVECSDADASIGMLAAMAERGGEYTVEYSSEGSAFWLFHDLAHVVHDVDGDRVDGFTLDVSDPSAEARASVQGGLRALRGPSPLALSEVVGEIARNESDFRERFDGMDSDALGDLLDLLTVTVPVEGS